MFHDVDNSRRTWRHRPTATCGDRFRLLLSSLVVWGFVFVGIVQGNDLFSIVQQFSIMTRAAERVQYVAVMGLILKLPNVCLYFWIMRHIERIEELQFASALTVRE